MVIALPDPMATRLTLKRALSLAPDLDITLRAHINDVLYQFPKIALHIDPPSPPNSRGELEHHL
jgi:hypothetical protein